MSTAICENVSIERVTPDSISQLQKISKQTFVETFSAVNAKEDMAKYLEEELSLEKLSAELNTNGSEFYFAMLNSRIIGYLKLNVGQAQTELKDDNALELERIYVLQEFIGQGVGKLLYQKAVQAAQQLSVDYIWLGVWEKNYRAISFYKMLGFVEFDKHIFRLGNDKQIDIMMKCLA